jgi:hypothetical protein
MNSKDKPHLYFKKGYWRARYGAWEFAGSSPTMAYNNYKHWNNFNKDRAKDKDETAP